MIRINLSPNVKRKAAGKPKTTVGRALPATNVSRGSVFGVVMLLGWIGLGVVGWLVLGNVDTDTARIKGEAAKATADAAALTGQINEEELQARSDRYDRFLAAEEKVEKERRSPVYVMHEVNNILTTGRGPDMDEVEYRKQKARDPLAELDTGWDATSVWLSAVVEEENGVLEISGGARDPDDLSEFVKRLRASARFERVSHPEYELQEVKASGSSKPVVEPGKLNHDFYTFELTAKVRYWD